MRILGFTIENFKGIKKANIQFSDNDKARVHTLVGLNESGKTTLLEAIHSFSPDIDTEVVVRGVVNNDQQREQWVPRDQFSIFTGDVSVTAHILSTAEDWKKVTTEVDSEMGLEVDGNQLPTEFTIRLGHEYKNGDYVTTVLNINIPGLKVKSSRAKNFRPLTSAEIMAFSRIVRKEIPTIAYYPNFVFDFPNKIYLTGRDDSPKNKFYRQLFQDILDYTGAGYTINDSIIARLHRKENQGAWEEWLEYWYGTSEKTKVDQVVARAERAVTEVVFSKWKDVFGEAAGNKRIQIELGYEKGKKIKNEDGSESEAVIHDAYIQFKIMDGPDPYAVEDRSLGFRWFFCFLLFTQFRLHRENSRPTIFLFDEPASNLHAAAQMKLLESFPQIACEPHRLIYSTHSHYMVNPKWLEQAHIVYNKRVDPDGEIIDSSLTNESDICSVKYRNFVQSHPNKVTYFQPILDTLKVLPSRFDYRSPGIIVEGKNDYYCISLALEISSEEELKIFPGMGSGTLGALVALHRGWGIPVKILFDKDQGGRDGRKKLRADLSISDSSIITIADISKDLKTIEDVFSEKDRAKLTDNKPSHKSVLHRKVQEALASKHPLKLDSTSKKRMKLLVAGLKKSLEE